MANSNFRTLQVDYLAGINANRSYIRNGLALQGTTGYATYADTGDRPVDGTGGVANVTWTVTTTNPLRGESSFLFTKDAANRQGQGVSYLFTIDEADRAKVLQIEFDYAVNSGTYVTGDLAIYVVDTVNGTVIQPSAYSVENVGVSSLARLTFQTAANSSSYRLCFHVASTSALAYSLKFDNISIGSQIVPIAQMRGPIGSIIYLGTATAPGGYIAANGAAVSRTTYAKLFSVIGTTFGSGDGSTTFNVPDTRGIFIRGAGSQVIGSETYTGVLGTKQNDNFQAHSHNVTDASGNQQSINNVPTGSATGPIPRGSTFNTTSNLITSIAGSGTETYPANISLHGYICFDEGSTILSSSADTRVVAFNAYKISGAQSSSGTYQDVTSWSTATIDTHGAFDASTGVWTCKVPGRYRVYVAVGFAASSAGNLRAIDVKVNGGTSIIEADAPSSAVSISKCDGSAIVDLVANDTIKVRAFQNTGASLNYSTIVGATNFSIEMLQGPNQIAASEVISMRVKTTGVPTASPGLANSTTSTLIFATVQSDTHNAYNATTGEYRIPAPGIYNIRGVMRPSGTFGVAGVMQANIFINGVLEAQFTHEISNGSGNTMSPSIMVDGLPLKTGDIVTFRVIPSGWSTIGFASDPSFHSFSVQRVGGVM